MPSKYSNKLIRKPWGFEYLFYENEEVAVWCLHIKAGQSTSLHCHPNKKTGLIMLEGEAELSFLNDTTPMKPLDRHILRPGLFHSTTAITDSVLLELETPPIKEDIVRFDDKYGRKGKPIEGTNEMFPLPKKYPRLVNGCFVSGYHISVSPFPSIFAGVIAVLKGGLISDNGDVIVGPGDVGSLHSLSKLQNSFKSVSNTEILSVCVPPH